MKTFKIIAGIFLLLISFSIAAFLLSDILFAESTGKFFLNLFADSGLESVYDFLILLEGNILLLMTAAVLVFLAVLLLMKKNSADRENIKTEKLIKELENIKNSFADISGSDGMDN